MNGTFEDAKDIFQDALVVFYEKLTEGNLNIFLSRKAYILGISKHLWVRKYRQDFAKVGLDNLEMEISVPRDYFPEPETKNLLSFLELTGKKCLNLLKLFYYNKLSMSEIADVFNYSSVRSATVQKYKCLEKVRDQIKQKSLSYEDFIG